MNTNAVKYVRLIELLISITNETTYIVPKPDMISFVHFQYVFTSISRVLMFKTTDVLEQHTIELKFNRSNNSSFYVFEFVG